MASKAIGPIKTPYGTGTLWQRFYGNGAIALVIEPQICTVSVNLAHGQPCKQSDDLPPGHFYVDANNLSRDMLQALHASGYCEPSALPDGVSGYCTYPVWKLRATEAAS